MSDHRFLSITATLLIVCVGCTSNVYVVELTPTDNALRRTLEVVEVTGDNRSRARSLNAEQRKRLIDAYSLEAGQFDQLPGKMTGVFSDRMPEDVGGFGSYHQFESPLGVARFYSERFRGNLDLAKTLQQRRQSLDEAVDLVQRWASAQWPDDGEGIATWVDTVLRRDLHNVLLLVWTHSAALEVAEGKTELTKGLVATHFAYLGQYAAENDYLQWKEIPILFNAINTEDADTILRIAHEVIARKLQDSTGRDYRQSLQILLQPEQFKNTMQAFLKTTEEYQTLLRETETDLGAAGKDSTEPNAFTLITEPLFEAFIPAFLFGGDRVEVRLHLDEPPVQTNGVWDDEKHVVRWDRSLKATPIPPLAFAVWVEPNGERQNRLFGETKLNGESLAMHATWYAGLSEAEKIRWSDFLETLVERRNDQPSVNARELFENALSEIDFSDSKSLTVGIERTKENL